MELSKGHIAFAVACFVAGCIIGVGLRSCSTAESPTPEPTIIHDTVCLRDTIRIAAKTRIIRQTVTDTVIVRDTDTIVVSLPIETKQYLDTFITDTSRIELGVQFTGYKARIDGIELKSQYTMQPMTIEKKKGWGQFIGIGIGVGYGSSVVGKHVYAAPEIGVHITYGWGYHW